MEKGDGIFEGLQEDGKTYLTFRRDDSDSTDDDDDGDKKGGKDGKDGLDLSFLPEESRGKVKELFGLLEEKFSAELDALQYKADMVDVLVEQLKNPKQPESRSDTTENKKKGLFEDVAFEEGDYYAKFFKRVFGAMEEINNRLDGLSGTFIADKVQTKEEKMKSFFRENKLPKEVVQKMDEIAQELGGGGKAYDNLPRLLKLAKYELGISDTQKQKNEDDIPRNRDRGKRTVFEFSSSRKSGVEKPVIKSMLDAWNAAEDQLRQEK